jgi:hypothetical protein
MNLRNKFLELRFCMCEDESQIDNFVDAADDFAIGFAEWCTKYRDKNRNVNGEMLHAKSKYDETYLTKELLEMYKKEQKL